MDGRCEPPTGAGSGWQSLPRLPLQHRPATSGWNAERRVSVALCFPAAESVAPVRSRGDSRLSSRGTRPRRVVRRAFQLLQDRHEASLQRPPGTAARCSTSAEETAVSSLPVLRGPACSGSKTAASPVAFAESGRRRCRRTQTPAWTRTELTRQPCPWTRRWCTPSVLGRRPPRRTCAPVHLTARSRTPRGEAAACSQKRVLPPHLLLPLLLLGRCGRPRAPPASVTRPRRPQPLEPAGVSQLYFACSGRELSRAPTSCPSTTTAPAALASAVTKQRMRPDGDSALVHTPTRRHSSEPLRRPPPGPSAGPHVRRGGGGTAHREERCHWWQVCDAPPRQRARRKSKREWDSFRMQPRGPHLRGRTW
jgi:hypothetical protein